MGGATETSPGWEITPDRLETPEVPGLGSRKARPTTLVLKLENKQSVTRPAATRVETMLYDLPGQQHGLQHEVGEHDHAGIDWLGGKDDDAVYDLKTDRYTDS